MMYEFNYCKRLIGVIDTNYKIGCKIFSMKIIFVSEYDSGENMKMD